MQLFADTSGLPVSVPASSEMPARGAALFGAVAAGEFDDIGAAIAADPAGDRPHVPARAASRGDLRRVYAIYRSLYELLGSSQAELLHGLKRIRDRERRAA